MEQLKEASVLTLSVVAGLIQRPKSQPSFPCVHHSRSCMIKNEMTRLGDSWSLYHVHYQRAPGFPWPKHKGLVHGMSYTW